MEILAWMCAVKINSFIVNITLLDIEVIISNIEKRLAGKSERKIRYA
jgi:hypothetical protein